MNEATLALIDYGSLSCGTRSFDLDTRSGFGDISIRVRCTEKNQRLASRHCNILSGILYFHKIVSYAYYLDPMDCAVQELFYVFQIYVSRFTVDLRTSFSPEFRKCILQTI